MKRTARILFLVTCVAVAITSPALAADAPEKLAEAKVLTTKLAALRKAKDVSGFLGELNAAVELHNALTHSATRGKIQKELGAALKSKHMKAAHLTIVSSLAEMNDSKGVYKQFKRLLPDVKAEEVSELELAIVKAVGDLAPSSALKVLFELALKAKNLDLAAAAITGLGNYGKSKKRVLVLEELINLIKRFRPSQSTDKAASPETQAKWNKLSPPIIASLNQLTGQKIRDPAEWEQTWKDSKKRPRDLFIE